MNQQDAPDFKVLELVNCLPGIDRPVKNITLYHDGERYGGFTSEAHAHLVAKNLGFEKYEVKTDETSL